MSTYTKLENCKAEIKVQVESEIWTKAQEKAFDKISKKVTVKGFRKGQAPKNLIKKQINPQEILFEAVDSIIQDELIKAVEEHEVEIIDKPKVSIEKISEAELTLLFEIMVTPDVEAKTYEGLGYQLPELTVSDEEVENEVKKMRERYADLELKEDGVVENGDTAIVDYEGFKDGVAFEGGKGENHPLVIGSHSFIPGFEEGLIGMKQDETKDLELTFPEEYHSEELKGAKVVFKVKVNEIKTKVLPEIDEEFFENIKIEGVDNLEKLNEHLRKDLLEKKKDTEKSKLDEEMLERLIEKNPFEIPEVMITNESNEMVNEFSQRLAYNGMDIDSYLAMTKLTKEDLVKSYRDGAIKRIKVRLLFRSITKKENLKVSQDEVAAEYNRYSEMYKMPVEELKKYIREDDLKEELKFQKAFEFVREH